ncbi:MAG: hypothetical protein AAFQ57_02560 [Cyanobacteria bacterium J06626_14]
MTLILCPGVHSAQLTQSFLNEMAPVCGDSVVFPTECYLAYSPWQLTQFLETTLNHTQLHQPAIFIGFSAGVVAAIATAWWWQFNGRSVKALIALDGWGVPLRGSFPIHRMSHDRFTHWSSTLGESLEDCFYADPAIEHLDLWRSPSSAYGQWVRPTSEGSLLEDVSLGSAPRSSSAQITAAHFLRMLLQRYRS